MSVKVSKRVEHAIKATAHLARRYKDGYVQAHEIAEQEKLPAKFLETILPQLKSARIVESRVGIGGGYRLAKPPEKTLVKDIIGPVEFWPSSSRGRATQGDRAFTKVCGSIQTAMDKEFGRTTIAELAGVRSSRRR